MLDQFKTPPTQYRLAPFWVWNQIPDPVEIDRQIRDMYAKGIGGFFIDGRQARGGNGTEEALVQSTSHACEAAERLGLSVYQYEQSPLRRIPPTLDTKLRTSAVHTSGGNRALGKVFGQHGWSLSMAEMKRVIDRQACLGVNFFAPEAFHYSIAGLPLRGAAPSQFYQATYWRYYKLFADYAARLSYVLSQGQHKPQAALLRPRSYSDPLDRATTDWLNACCESLLAEHIDFDIIDEDSLASASYCDDKLSVAGEEYGLLVLPPLASAAYRTAQKIAAFVDEGGKLVVIGRLPAEDSTGEMHAEVRQAFTNMFGPQGAGNAHLLEISRPSDLPSAISQALNATIKRAVSVRRGGSECADIACIRRSTDDADVFFLANYADEARETRISFRCDRAPHMLNLETGDCTALPNCTQQGNRTVLLHRFEAYGSLLVAFGNEPALAVSPPSIESGQEIALSDEWTFVAEQPNCITLPDWSFNTLILEDQELYEYTTSFDAECVPDDLALALEQTDGFRPGNGLTIYVNDAEAPALASWTTDIALRSVDIARLAQRGRNTVRMTVEREGWTGEPQPVPARARLLGSFSLSDGATALQPIKEFVRNGSWTDQGYPYYSGTACYRQVVYIPHFARGQRIALRVQNPADIVEFVINGAIAAVRPWAPFDVDITPLVKPGPNQIELRVTNSLANMLLSQPKPSGLIGGAIALLA